MQTKYAVLGVLALAIIGVALLQINKPAQPETITTNQTLMQNATTVPTQPDTTMEKQSLKDGVYEATGEYKAPSGVETLGVTVTLKDGIVVDSEIEILAKHDTSKRMQGLFKGGYKEKVIGMPIADIQLGAISGSSLTPKGFNDALQKIQEQAAI